jgi:AraC-like DNA-binding protein
MLAELPERMAASSAPPEPLRRRFVAAVERLAPRPGRHVTAWPGLTCYRVETPSSLEPTVYRPAFCVVAQGAKEGTLASTRFRYDPFQYLVIGAPMPVRARILEASPARPYLSLTLEVQATQARPLLVDLEAAGERFDSWDGAPPLSVSALDSRFLDALVRFLEAIDDALERRVLAPGALREVLYLALRGAQGHLLTLALGAPRRSAGVARALRYIHAHLDERFDVTTLARAAGMSASGLHRDFKATTTVSPVQYVKSLRLDQARRLMLDEGLQAAEAALRVGYESPSQFSREFKRTFGLPPHAYRRRQEGPR